MKKRNQCPGDQGDGQGRSLDPDHQWMEFLHITPPRFQVEAALKESLVWNLQAMDQKAQEQTVRAAHAHAVLIKLRLNVRAALFPKAHKLKHTIHEPQGLIDTMVLKLVAKRSQFKAKSDKQIQALVRQAVHRDILDCVRVYKNHALAGIDPADHHGLQAQAPTPLEAAMYSEFKGRVRKFLATLPQNQQIAAQHIMQGCNWSETARQMQMSPKQVYRLRSAIKAKFKQWFPGNDEFAGDWGFGSGWFDDDDLDRQPA